MAVFATNPVCENPPTDWLHLRDALRGRCTGCDALRGRCTGCDALRGRCTGCDARTSADRLHLRDALRGRCTGCDTLTSADWLHLRDALLGARWLQLQAQAAPCFWRMGGLGMDVRGREKGG